MLRTIYLRYDMFRVAERERELESANIAALIKNAGFGRILRFNRSVLFIIHTNPVKLRGVFGLRFGFFTYKMSECPENYTANKKKG